MTNYKAILDQDTAPTNLFHEEIIDMTIDQFVEEYCPNHLYFNYDWYLSQKPLIKGKILEIMHRGNSLMDKEWVEEVIEGYFPKDRLWEQEKENLAIQDMDKKIEIFSDKVKLSDYIIQFYLSQEKGKESAA